MDTECQVVYLQRDVTLFAHILCRLHLIIHELSFNGNAEDCLSSSSFLSLAAENFEGLSLVMELGMSCALSTAIFGYSSSCVI